MRKRCENPRDQAFARYGGRGIGVCPRWSSFEAFIEDMGWPGADQSIDRIDPNGNYEPENCRWASTVAQANNKRNNRRLSNGKTVAEAAREQGLPYATAYYRATGRP